MPRDLDELKLAEKFVKMDPLGERDLQGKSDLEKTADQKSPEPKSPETAAEEQNDMINSATKTQGHTTERDELHPYTNTLTLNDVDSCTILEEHAFPPQERCTKEKFHYRLSACPELTLGIFISTESNKVPTYASSSPVYSGAPNRKSVLVGHIVCTATTNRTVTDADMAMPSASDAEFPKKGHKDEGRTVCIHSLAVLPEYQRRGLGRTLMKGFLGRLRNQDVADRVALIAHGHLVQYYESLGFESKGESAAQFGGGGWIDMVMELRGGTEE